MKKTIFFILFFTFLTSVTSQTLSSPSISIIAKWSAEKSINIIGLELLEIVIINNTDEVLITDDTSNLFFEARLGNATWNKFYEGNAKFANRRADLQIAAKDSIAYKSNINLFEMLRLGIISDDDYREITIRVGAYCYKDKKNYYSTEKNIKLNSLSKIDKQAIGYINKNGFDPYSLTRRGNIAAFGINTVIADSIMAKFPSSSFAEIAEVSLAYKIIMIKKEKTSVQSLLEKPLKSKYSFIRYLAEELKKSQ